MATCSLEYDKIQTITPLCDEDDINPLGGVARGECAGMPLNSACYQMGSNDNVRDVFEWGDSNFSIHSSEISQVSESLFDSMRSG